MIELRHRASKAPRSWDLIAHHYIVQFAQRVFERAFYVDGYRVDEVFDVGNRVEWTPTTRNTLWR